MDISFETVALLSTAFGILIYVTIKRLIFLSKLPPGNNGLIHKLVHNSIKGCKHKISLFIINTQGPWGLPFIGQLINLNKNNALLVLQKWQTLYGKIFSYSIGDF
jgi:hypothetical protein